MPTTPVTALTHSSLNAIKPRVLSNMPQNIYESVVIELSGSRAVTQLTATQQLLGNVVPGHLLEIAPFYAI
jgi:hypothetical protein